MNKKVTRSPFDTTGPSVFQTDAKFNGLNLKKQTTEAMPAVGFIPVTQTKTKRKSTFGVHKRKGVEK